MPMDASARPPVNPSPRELEAIRLASEGFSNDRISAEMQISRALVKLYLHRAAERLDLTMSGGPGLTRARLSRWYGERMARNTT